MDSQREDLRQKASVLRLALLRGLAELEAEQMDRP
jgi:hypothetical protein